MQRITSMKDWVLEYRKRGPDGRGWYWRLETDTDIWESGSYCDKQSAIDDFKEMAEQRGFEVEQNEEARSKKV